MEDNLKDNPLTIGEGIIAKIKRLPPEYFERKLMTIEDLKALFKELNNAHITDHKK